MSWRTLPLLLLPIAAWAPAQTPPPAAPWSPADSVRAAAADLARLPAQQQRYTRYLDLGAVPPDERPALIQTLAGHVNSLSREPDLIPPVAVPGTAGAVLRINVEDYGWDVAVWERLVSPYQHVTVEAEVIEDWPGGVWRDGYHYGPGTFRVRKKVRRQALAPWLSEGPGGPAALAALVAGTRSKSPLVSGPWFLWQTVVQEGRGKAGYYDFLRVKDQKAFEALIRFDGKLARGLEQRRVVVFSGVAQEPRRLERTVTVLGGYWRTFDSAVATDKHNPLRLLDDEDFRYDATEQFAALPNGLPAWWLADGAGKRLDKAADNVVSGDRTSAKDGRLHVNLSCVRCHFAAKESGIMAIDAAPLRNIGSPDYAKLRELRRQYLRDVGPLMDADRRGYAGAVRAASGLDIKKYGQELSRWYVRHDEARVDLEWAARDAGTTAGRLKRALALAERAGTLDPVLSVVLAGGQIPMRQYEETIVLIHQALQGVKR